MRTGLGPALLARTLRRARPRDLPRPLRFLSRSGTATVLAILAAGELVADKLPSTPDRVAPAPLAGRALFGAALGGAVAAVEGRSVARAAVTGALVAIAAAELTYHARRWLGQHTRIPDPLIGAAEDLLVTGLAGAALAGLGSRPWRIAGAVRPAPPRHPGPSPTVRASSISAMDAASRP